MKLSKRTVLMIILAGVFLTGCLLMLRQALDYRNAQQAYQQAIAIASQPASKPDRPVPPLPLRETISPTEPTAEMTEPTEATEPMDDYALQLSSLDIAALQQVNEEVLGWIQIPDTAVSYPLMHTTDNSTYLSLAWDGSANRAGSIFLETKNNPTLEDFNTIIYGHHMRNGSMFADIMNYRQKEFREAHPYIYIVTEGFVRRYKVFSTYEAGITTDTYRLYFKDDVQKRNAIRHYLTSSVELPTFAPTPEDCILTLSTCTGTGTYETRWVVQAVLTDIWEV